MRHLIFDRLHYGLSNVLELRQKQHSLTAANIANADTPHYKAKYIRFDNLLREAVGTGETEMKRTHGGHVSGLHGTTKDPSVFTIDPAPWVLDGNSVSLEREMVRLKENSLMFRSVTKGITKKIAMLRFAASNGKG